MRFIIFDIRFLECWYKNIDCIILDQSADFIENHVYSIYGAVDNVS